MRKNLREHVAFWQENGYNDSMAYWLGLVTQVAGRNDMPVAEIIAFVKKTSIDRGIYFIQNAEDDGMRHDFEWAFH